MLRWRSSCTIPLALTLSNCGKSTASTALQPLLRLKALDLHVTQVIFDVDNTTHCLLRVIESCNDAAK
jgi:uncharacterized protein (UPF0371 family)